MARAFIHERYCDAQAKDPLESTNEAPTNPEIVARLQQELARYTAKRYTRGLDKARTKDHATYCTWIEKVGWVQPYDPLP